MHTQGKVEPVHGAVMIRSLNPSSDVDILVKCGEEMHSPETFANRDRIAALWNAADGMTTEEAVRLLENGREMKRLLGLHCDTCQDSWMDDGRKPPCDMCTTRELLTKMEVHDGNANVR